jgi:hypothetical protein
MRQVIEKAVAQFLLRSTDPVHTASSSHRSGSSFHGGAEGDEYQLEMNHISKELNHQLSSVVADSSVLSTVCNTHDLYFVFQPFTVCAFVHPDHRPTISQRALLY